MKVKDEKADYTISQTRTVAQADEGRDDAHVQGGTGRGGLGRHGLPGHRGCLPAGLRVGILPVRELGGWDMG